MVVAILTVIPVVVGVLWLTQIARVQTGDTVLMSIRLSTLMTSFHKSVSTLMLALLTLMAMSVGSTASSRSGALVMTMRISHPL